MTAPFAIDKKHEAFIDVLRGIAILMVVMVHHGQKFAYIDSIKKITSYGQMGVQLFFVCSAFTLMKSFANRRDENNAISKFYIRRYFRIAPLYYIAIFMYFILYKYVKKTGFEIYTPHNVILNFLFLHGFSKSAFNGVVPGGWSIGTEMAFYAIFPAIFHFYQDARLSNRFKIYIVPIVIAAASTIIQITISALDPSIFENSFIYYNLINQISVFSLGISAFLLYSSQQNPTPSRSNLAICPILLLLSIAVEFEGKESLPLAVYQPLSAFISGVAFSSLILVAKDLTENWFLKKIADIGRVSYSMYIFHFIYAWPITQLLVDKMGRTHSGELALYLPTLILTIALSYVTARLSTDILEKQGIALGRKIINKMK